MTQAEQLIGGDTVVATHEAFAGNTFINGWVTVRGVLECGGDLHCLGMSIESGGSVKCRELVVNILDAAPAARIDVLQVSARVVQHARLALRDAVDAGTVKADYIQHIGDGTAPDYVRGPLPLAQAFYEERSRGAPVVLEMERIRDALRTSKSVFKSRDFLVAPRSKAAVAAATRHPLVEELARWLDTHPGPQRVTAEAIAEEWLPRLRGLSAEARADAVFVIRKAIRSPKLVDLVEAISVALGAA